MQIRFRLPGDGTVGDAVQINRSAESIINKDLVRWSEKYQVDYTTTLCGRYLYLNFDSPQTVSFFLLTYKPQYNSSSRKRIEIVDAQNNLIEDFLSV